jgi:hypothetical protein
MYTNEGAFNSPRAIQGHVVNLDGGFLWLCYSYNTFQYAGMTARHE